jgi:hypothetical protein
MSGRDGRIALHAPLFPTETGVVAHDTAAADEFGASVAASGDTTIVGAPGEMCGVPLYTCGAAYVFERTGSGWTEQQKLVAGDAGGWHDYFGASVALSSDTAVVGAYGDACTGAGVGCGSAYVFVRTGTVWIQQQRLLPDNPAAEAYFGWSVAISGDTVVVGAIGHGCPVSGNSCGAAYVFVRTGTSWTQQQKLVPGDVADRDYFGRSVAVSDDTAIVGASGKDCGSPNTDCGAAYAFARAGALWTEQQKLTANDAAFGDLLGYSVALSGNTAVAGALWDDCAAPFTNCGAAYVFVRSASVWTQQQKLTASDRAPDDQFGASVAVSGDRAVVGAIWHDCTPSGADCGAAYVFTRMGTVWSETQKLLASDGAASDYFGGSVGLSGNTAVVGAYGTDCAISGLDECGAAYIYDATDSLFADDFDSGTLEAWTVAATDGGDLSVTSDAGLIRAVAAVTYGLQALVNDTNPLYVEDHTPDGELRYRVRFWLDTHTFDPGEANGRFRARVLLGLDSDPVLRRLFAVVLRRRDGAYSLMVRTTRADGTRANTSFMALSPGAHSVQLDWQRSSAAGLADGSLTLWIDDVLQEAVTGIDTGMHGIDFVRLGPTSLKAGANGILFFDRFESRRLSMIQ